MGRFNSNRGSFDRPRFDANRGSDRPLFKTICSNCGKDCEVPFRPTNGKPVYCSDCFEKMGNTRSDSPRNEFGRNERPNFRPQAPAFDQTKAQFDGINVKLERIIRLLETKAVTPTVSVPVVEEVKEIKTPKVKKSPIKK